MHQKELDELLKFAVDLKVTEDEKYNMIKQYIDNRYPMFKKIDISNINFSNVWDILDLYKQKYGDEFILSPINKTVEQAKKFS